MNTRPWSVGIVAVLVAAVALTTPAAARPSDGGDRPPIDGGWTAKWSGPGWSAATMAAERRSAVPAAATEGGAELIAAAGAVLVPCEDDPTFLCGTVPVPLDRRNPDGRMVNLHVEVFPHTGPDEQADGAVFVTCGGPGCSITLFPKYGFSFFVLPAIAETRDLVFVDQRGVGLSDVIDCPELQAGGPLYESAAACHDQLGDTADLYSTTDVADDLEDVRQALGYEQIDLFGGSYAGPDMMTYAVRHTDHVRSVVLASPVVVVGADPFWPYPPEAMPEIVAGLCGSSPACVARHRNPAKDFARLARRLRRHPISGVGIDSTGSSHEMTVTENIVAQFIMYNDGGGFVGPGEITPAGAAARRGDLVPLLRLAADVDPANGFDSGDVREFSAGHNLARSCVDFPLPFDKAAPKAVREAQFAAALDAEPDLYGVISKEAWAAPGYLGYQPSPCIASTWEDRPLYPAGTRVDGVPTLVLGGEYDVSVPESVSQLATEVLTDSTYVSMSGAGHDPQFWSDRGPELVQRFIADLDVGDTSCADQPAGGWWVPGSFPKRANQAPPADQASGKRVSRSTRRLVTAAAWTVMDSLRHNFTVPDDSVALRGGIVDWERIDDESAQWTLEDARFTKDLRVSGTITGVGPLFDGDITVDGPRRHDTTTMHFNGEFFVAGADITITTTSRGKTATFTVPGY